METDKFTKLLELTAALLRALGLVELAYGYYDGLVKVCGYITGLGRDDRRPDRAPSGGL